MAIQYPLNFILFLPKRNNSADNGDKSSSDISGIVKNICSEVEKRFPANIVLWKKVYGNENLGSEGFYGGIACGDDALNQINSTYFGKIPILALTGMTKTRDDGNGMEKGVYPLCPLPGFSGFLFSRSIIASWEAKSKKDSKKKPTIAFLGMEKADDPQRKRFAAFERTLRSHLQEPLIEVFPFSSDDIKEPQTIFGKLKCWEKTIGKTIDYVACFGYGEGYDNLITSLAKDFKSAEFWCDYNFTEDHPHNNIQRIGLRSCMGKDFFIQMACAGADILKTAFQHAKLGDKTALGFFDEWVNKPGFFQSAIGTLWFVRSNDDRTNQTFTLRQTFYRSVEGDFWPVDSTMPEEVLPAENLIDFLDKADTLTLEWTGDNSSAEQLIDKVSDELTNYFRDLHHIEAMWPGKMAGVESANFRESTSMTSPLQKAVNAIMDCCRGQTHIVQINLIDDDMEDNGVYRLYALIHVGENRYLRVPIREYLRKQKLPDNFKGVQIGPNARDANIPLGKDSRTIVEQLFGFFPSGNKTPDNKECRFIYLLDCTPREHPRSGKEDHWWGIAYAVEKLNAKKIKIIHQVLKSAYSAVMVYQEKERTLKAQIRSAIGSIMSRNGSHNIGSHVLAALSHNVGTMPDDRVLYQYIQHRMDYIATATTDFPTWRQPTMFLGTMMKTFLAQRHLLDHIAGSEGLKGWKFQDRNSPDGRATSGNSNCLQFRIYPNAKDEATGQWTRIIEAKQNGKEGFVECIDYDEGRMAHLSYDVSLAIPGGTVGQHAFFTIIENIIRNAAKHDWSSPPESKAKAENLEINIDFADIPEEGKVLFTISTNLSDVSEKEDTSEKGVRLIDRINQKLSEPFIDSSGALRRENWGLAEMKISAGYLQGRDIGLIGGIESKNENSKGEESPCGSIIKAVKVDGGHLGYQFWVPKARTLLLVTPDETRIPDDMEKNLNSHGIYVKPQKEVAAANTDNSFEFVLVHNPQKEIAEWLPSRVVNAREPVENIRTLLIKDRIAPKDVIDRVATEYVKQLWREELPLNLVVAPIHKGCGGGQGLVDKAAATAFVFENGFQKVVDSFKDLNAQSYEDVAIQGGLARRVKVFCEAIGRLFLLCGKGGKVGGEDVEGEEETDKALKFFLGKASSEGISEELKQGGSKDYIDLMKIQFKSWLKDSPTSEFPSIQDFINGVNGHVPEKFGKFCAYFTEACKQAKGYLGLYAEQIATLPKGFEHNPDKRKGAEGHADANDLFYWTKRWNEANIVIDKESNPETARTGAVAPAIGFLRHEAVFADETTISVFVDNPFASIPNFRYLEPLSGSQSYLVQLQALAQYDRVFQAKLIECALTRILIVDERVSKFATTHSAEIRATFARMGIRIADDKATDDALNGREVNGCVAGLLQLPFEEVKALRTSIAESENEEMLRKRMEAHKNVCEEFRQKFDVLIIHQGILDKWFRGLVDNKGKMSLVLVALQEVFKKVVITTGRGTPANIPDRVRVLPFSTIETTLFKKYPEKLILVDAIMNILPIRKG